MHRDNAIATAHTLMTEHGLIDSGWRFKFNTNKRRVGLCREGVRMIEFSSSYLAAVSAQEFKNVILHEIAHALVGCGHGHDSVWKAKARAIGAEAKSTTSIDPTKVESLYHGTCDCNSDNTWKAHRLGKTKVTGHCPKCLASITWTDTRTGIMTYRGQVVTSSKKSSYSLSV